MSGLNLADALNGILGAESINPDDYEKVRGYLDTGIPELNRALSGRYRGGIPMGRMIEVFGPASSGKTFMSTMVMAAAQRMGGLAFFADHERTFDPELARKLGLSLDSDKFRWLKPKTFEESVDTAVKTAIHLRKAGLDINKPIVWVFDSVASMVPQAKLYDDKGQMRKIGDYNMRDKLLLAQATSQSYPQLAQAGEDYNLTVILLNQIRVDPTQMFGDPTTTPGGKAAEFYASIRLSLGRKDVKGKDKEVIGALVSAKAIKNKVTRPFLKAQWAVRFTEDSAMVDHIGTNLDFLVRAGIIKKEGTRIEWEGRKLFQSQVEALLRKDPEGNDKLLALFPEGEMDDLPEDVADESLEKVLRGDD